MLVGNVNVCFGAEGPGGFLLSFMLILETLFINVLGVILIFERNLYVSVSFILAEVLQYST